ncbi:methyltransferase domain-containing protein [Ottowia pentelensis]|uniref:Methyltransferase domain-containing protein n=1 Tax=Ottowia pentelensis TaxID=511108 RepID=A0ABV6PMR8_9BURK|nr:class I SAM-dependent methyltransferase [Ottowia sp.]MBS0404047.1 methyltransferase domain-containing protein [Pseudomonadota bacterium]MBS0414905.1 methyltransferase domain-containing protein [Pseudomonadota bacterium]
MSDSVHAAARHGFERQAGAYARGRPDYPPALQGWLRGALALGPGRAVADVGAGTGKFTPLLTATGAEVVAIEPVDAMRAQLATAQPTVRAQPGTADALPLPDASLDAIVCAQAFHWFATRAALDEFARVLKPGGHLGLVWNVRDESVDWVAELTRIVTPHEGDAPRFYKGSWRQAFPHPAFGPLHESVFDYVHEGPPQQVIVDRFLSVSFIAALPAAEQARVRAQIEALIEHHPALRGQAVVRFPYRTRAFAGVRR